ncbi:MAG TPA: alkaline phosphatase family protein [Steroidobacteraceae bacterium]|jgi:phospholipase C|nr:alkaline phosphatase family protein [Steroidobacteraceae bacterium]
MTMLRKWPAFVGLAAMTANLAAPVYAFDFRGPQPPQTTTPIKHLVVIYQENISFDHYFATYPHATNPMGEPKFYAAPFTPWVDNLEQDKLLTNNPNLNTANGAGAANPFRLDRTQAATADQNHSYTPEQQAFDDGKMDLFPKYTGTATTGGAGAFGTTGQVMGYYDGNTVTALWNYVQHFAMSDNAYGAAFGPSTPGALEVVSGQTNGYEAVAGSKTAAFVDDGQGGYTDIGDEDPAFDACSSSTQMRMLGNNIGDLLNAKGISWGSFMGGFNLELTNANGTTSCARSSTSTITGTTADYVPHHAWFQYYTSTANPTHARPASPAAIGHTYDANGALDPANHEYDVNDFYTAVEQGNFPAVAYIKAPAYQDGHAGYSDPLDEQAFVVQLVNFLEQRPDWRETAVIINYDDSDGWYDHQYFSPTSASYSSADQLNGNEVCGTGTAPSGLLGLPINGRCGPGPRLPFILISPYAKPNYVSHQYITQASVVRFIEDNWLQGKRLGGGSFDASAGSLLDLFDFRTPFLNPPLFLDAQTGEPIDHPFPFVLSARVP